MNLRHSAWLVFVIGILAGSGLSAAPAYADARQDVMLGAQRCAGISDDRLWLDCFYGSAQPMRATLGLPPAPMTQQRLVPPAGPAPGPALAPVYAPPPSYAAPAPGYAAPKPARPAVDASGQPIPPPLPRRRSTGFFSSIFGSSKAVTSNQRMVSWTKTRDGRFRVTLSDGEIWEQEQGDTNVPDWRGQVSRRVVNIYEGALGTYNMNVSDDSTLYKVRRVN